ncbi:GIY-YIG nuclease family protein [Furfurilactobacillus sp. WILCCON 0119]|uniref:GIY-YIG nuclease family protein n=1 Tax=Furfurilactobacillus entadae TaxID=2922307 RepID=UPI0035E5D4B0
MNPQRKQQLLDEYAQIKVYYGVIQIKNKQNGKIYIAAVPNLKNRWSFYQQNLDNGSFPVHQLQADWKTFGRENFEFTELYRKDAADVLNLRQTLKDLREEWLAKLQPFGDRGYN